MAAQICIWPCWSIVETLVLSFCKKRSLRDYVRKWVVWSLFFNSDSIYKRSFDTSWIFSACVWEEGNFVLQRERDSPIYFQTQLDTIRILIGLKRKVWYGNTLGSHMTSGFLLAGKKKLWFGNSLGCPSHLTMIHPPFSDQAILSTFRRRHFARTNIC